MTTSALKELIERGPIVEAGSLDTASLSLDRVEMEASLLHSREGLKVAQQAAVPGQIMAYEGQIEIAETLLTVDGIEFPEIIGAGHEYSGWSRNRTVRGIKIPDSRPKRRFRRANDRYYVATDLDVYNKPMPISCLESYQRAQQLGVFDSFQVWDRAKDYGHMTHRVDYPSSSYVKVEVDPYLVGVIRFFAPDRINTGDEGEIVQNVTATSPMYFLIDRWDEIEPMP